MKAEHLSVVSAAEERYKGDVAEMAQQLKSMAMISICARLADSL